MSRAVAPIRSQGPEFEVMCQAARMRFGAAEAKRIEVLSAGEVDWPAFLAGLERNYVAPVVYRNLASMEGLNIPPKALDTMRVRSLITSWKGLQFATELVRLSQYFETHSIQVIHYKGAVAAQQYYGSVTLRTFNDLDFLVRRSDLDALGKLLEADGYRMADQFAPDQREHFISQYKEFLFQRGEFALEPHWSLTMRPYAFETDYEGFWQRARSLDFRGEALRVFGAEDALLVLCLVGAKGRWKRLQMVCDIAECLRTFSDIDWAAVKQMAGTTGTMRILYLGLALAADLSGAVLPANIDREIRATASLQRLVQEIVGSLARPPSPPRYLPDSPSIFSPLLFRQRERFRDRWRYLWLTTTTPSVLHMERIPLPGAFSPLYRIIAPLHDYVAFPVGRYLESLGSKRDG
jgi:hypothetical protein